MVGGLSKNPEDSPGTGVLRDGSVLQLEEDLKNGQTLVTRSIEGKLEKQ